MFQLTRFSHNTVFFRNQNARYAGTRCTTNCHLAKMGKPLKSESPPFSCMIFCLQLVCKGVLLQKGSQLIASAAAVQVSAFQRLISVTGQHRTETFFCLSENNSTCYSWSLRRAPSANRAAAASRGTKAGIKPVKARVRKSWHVFAEASIRRKLLGGQTKVIYLYQVF